MRTMLGVVVAAIVAAPGAAVAGGVSTFEFDDDLAVEVDYLVTGDVVTGTSSAYFELRARMEEPFYAYLRPVGSTWVDLRDRPSVHDDAVRVGEVELGRVRPFRNGYWADARLEFTVPDVAPGRYALEYCNEDCTRWLGDDYSVYPTVVRIVASPLEARLRQRIDRVAAALEEEAVDSRIAQTRARTALRRVHAFETRLERERDASTALEARVDALGRRVRALAARNDGTSPGWIAVIAAAAAGVGLALLWRRRGRSARTVDRDALRGDAHAARGDDGVGRRQQDVARSPRRAVDLDVDVGKVADDDDRAALDDDPDRVVVVARR
ncbi:MAG TPA: hypothetical protein VHJ34_06240 [Actinomycetota bacterium]|nr:hypothetical protein [Actinomycetota bacterium]